VANYAWKVIALVTSPALLFNGPARELTAHKELNGHRKLLDFASRK
jgi:hypothetical protein